MAELYDLGIEIVSQVGAQNNIFLLSESEISSAAVELWKDTEDLGLVIDKIQRQELDEAQKQEKKVLEQHQAPSRIDLLQALCRQRSRVKHYKKVIHDEQRRSHLEAIFKNIDIRLVEALLWEKVTGKPISLVGTVEEE